MSRKSRKIEREEKEPRDTRLFWVACDDTYAPKQYFDSFKLTRVKIEVVPAENGKCSARAALDRLLNKPAEPDDFRWLLLDTDHYIRGSHRDSFIGAINDAKKENIGVALSRPCFEIWLLLHYVAATDISLLLDARQTGKFLKSVLNGYNKTKLKMELFPLERVFDAVVRARDCDDSVKGGDIPDANTTRVYLLWEQIFQSVLPSSIPAHLKEKLFLADNFRI